MEHHQTQKKPDIASKAAAGQSTSGVSSRKPAVTFQMQAVPVQKNEKEERLPVQGRFVLPQQKQPVTQRVISMWNPSKSFGASGELIEELSGKYRDIDKVALQHILEHMDRQGETFYNQMIFEEAIVTRSVFFNNLQGEYNRLLAELRLPDAPETKTIYAVVAASVPRQDIAEGRRLLRTRLTKAKTAVDVSTQVIRMLDDNTGDEKDSDEKTETGKATTLLFSWLYMNSERFTLGIRKRVSAQVIEIKKDFQSRRSVLETMTNEGEPKTLDEFYEAKLDSELIDTEITKAIQEEIPDAKKRGMVWPTVEFMSNIVTIMDGSEEEGLNNLEHAFTRYIETGFMQLQQGLTLDDGMMRTNFIKALTESACYPGRIANVRVAMTPPPASRTLIQEINFNIKAGADRISQNEISTVYILAEHYKGLRTAGGKTLDSFKAYARGQLAGPLASCGIPAACVDKPEVVAAVAYLF